MFELLGVLFGIVFLGMFLSILLSGWRVSRMVNKVFTLAEREMDRKLSDPSSQSPETNAAPAECSHCGRRVPTQAGQCPNCGATVP